MRNDLCDFNDAYIVGPGKITATNPGNDNHVYNRKVALKNYALFFNCVLKINNQLIEDAQDLDVVMPMYNLLYYSKNFRKTTGSFWNYYPDMPNSGYNDNNNERTRIFYLIKNSENFNYKTKLVGNLGDNLPVVNNLVKAEKIVKLKFNITDCKLYVPIVTLQTEYQKQLYEELKTGITIDFTWSKYRSQVIYQTATNNLNYLIDPTYKNVNKLFILAFEKEEDKKSFSEYYTRTIEIKDYNVILDGTKPFYEIPIKNKEETYKAITELIRDGIFRTGNEFSYEYFCTHYKVISIDLNRQKSEFENQQINFIGKLQQDATIFFIIEEKHTTGLEFLQNSLFIV